ncbi:MAG TPA: DUF4838 domain-containing protein [Clostridiales bacterium]|nr:MAG: hypothetical protein BWY37_00280 [Firmicutes bacterium ADurb.Bin262]HOU09137.1 DUF4838 domain-containing protein [Clostridiales bacterium]HQH62144.1 DUF4838 domain-containing protein [Clostridiales bacterium]HQK73864.1 DUF4838 domain-containing protein [Clostridiales bacterium]
MAFLFRFLNPTAKKTVLTVLSYLLFACTMFGIVNPAAPPAFTPAETAAQEVAGETVTLADGGASGYVIVKGAAASPAENTAAAKFRAIFKQISGVELPIVPDAAMLPTAKEIIIGKTDREGAAYAVDRAALGDDGFIIKTVGQNIVIAGGEVRGTLYGVFDFFQKFLGCKWLSSDAVIIPPRKAVAVPAAIDVRETPAFRFRAPTMVYNMTSVNADYALANKINGLVASVSGTEYGGIIRDYPGHTAALIVPPDKYFAEHPEYYALTTDGKRVTDNPCLSNEDVVQIYIDYAKKQIEANPNITSITMGLNDSDVVCHCPACEAVYAEEGAYSGTLVRLLNRVCEAIRPLNPNVKLLTFAYACTVEAPRTVCDENIIIYYCPIGMCYAHPLQECDYDISKDTCRQLVEWGKVTGNIYIFEYPMNYSEQALPYAKYDAMQKNIRFYYENHASGLFNCAVATCDPNFFVLDNYLYAKLLWNPYADFEAIMAEFMTDYFGEGWQYVREYLRMVSEECNGRSFLGVRLHAVCVSGATEQGNLSMGRDQVAYCDTLWAKAKALAKEDWQLKNLRSCEISWRTWKSDNFKGEFTLFQPPSKRYAANDRLFADIYELGVTQHDEGSVFVSPEDYERLDLNRLNPTFWTWRRLGREKQFTADSLWDIIFSWFNEI